MHLNDHVADLRLGRVRARARASAEIRSVTSDAAGSTPAPPVQPMILSDTISGDDSGVERRRSVRVALKSEILLRRVGGFNAKLCISNASSGGCRVELLEEFEVGDPIIARFPDLEPLGSRVSWTEGKTAGIQFLRSIHPAVFGSLIERLADSMPLDRFESIAP